MMELRIVEWIHDCETGSLTLGPGGPTALDHGEDNILVQAQRGNISEETAL